jgi:PadR family transcriptional regulator PadR
MATMRRPAPATLDVLDVLTNADGPIWGLRVVKDSGRKTGTVYPILQRLEALGWLTSHWDDGADRTGPRRRLYELTKHGAASAAVELRRAWATADASGVDLGGLGAQT